MELYNGFQIASLFISLLLLGYIVYIRISEEVRGKKSKKALKHDEPSENLVPKPDMHPGSIEMVRLENLRTVGYRGLCNENDLERSIFFINENATDAIGIFVEVVPEILNILMRTSYIMEEIDRGIDLGDIREKEITDHLMAMNMALESLTMVTSSLGHKIYEICSKKEASKDQVEANGEVIRGFIEMSTTMLNYVFEYLETNSVVYQKIKQKRLSFKEDFSDMSSGFLHIFFYGIVNCITMVESTITVLKPGKE